MIKIYTARNNETIAVIPETDTLKLSAHALRGQRLHKIFIHKNNIDKEDFVEYVLPYITVNGIITGEVYFYE